MNIGDRFGRLTFLGETEKRWKRTYGKFRCDCGNEKFIRLDGVSHGNTKSCGCMYNERKNKVGLDSATYEILYNVWRNMMRRCEDETSDRFYTYGERGITVCEEWHDFRTFAKWAVENGWKRGLSIERKTLDGNYCPDNCTFITMAEQARNKTSNIRIVIDGDDQCLTEWCRRLNFPFNVAWSRYRRLGYVDPAIIFYPGDLRSMRGWSAS